MVDRKGMAPSDINRRNKVHHFKSTHIEMELRAQVSSYLAKKDISVKEMCEVLNRILKSWETIILSEEKLK